MASFEQFFKREPENKAPLPTAKLTGDPASSVDMAQPAMWDDTELLDLHEKCKKEAFDLRWTFERQWTRNIWYVLGRQWIEYHSKDGQWKDKRLAKWVPRPVTQKAKETVQAIRAMFTSIQLGMTFRPNGSDPKNVSVANTADELAPLLKDNYAMDYVMSEFDWWLIVTGNAFLYTYWDYDVMHGMITVGVEECVNCGARVTSDKLAGAQPECPECGGNEFAPATDEMGAPATEKIAKGKGVTTALSPFEVAFPNAYPRFAELPYLYRLRWRSKSWFENHPDQGIQLLAKTLNFAKAPKDRSLQIFKALTTQNDIGMTPTYWSEGTSSGIQEEGTTEYELWYKPCAKYPEGLVARFVGEETATVIHLEKSEACPGPFPYVDAEGQPLFPFAHSYYDHVGGRILGSGALDPVIQKFDQINQLDSMIQMIIQRMANPIWLEPKGAEVEKFTGEPGLVVKWNPLTVGGNAKPERIAGEGPHGSFFQIREMYLKDIEDITGTFDIVKGAKPTGVEAFSALQLLVERSQSRFSSVFMSRGVAAAHATKMQLELEREFGPDEITKWVLSPNKRWTFDNFKRAQLQGSVTVVIENGSTVPKTNLGKRAAIEHLNQLGFVDPTDPDQKYKIYQEFGMSGLSPSLDIHVQAALQKQQAFEEWINDETAIQESQLKEQELMFKWQTESATQATDPLQAGQPPLPPPSPLDSTPMKWRKWYNATIHKQEFMKWANGDTIRELLVEKPEVEGLLEAHLMEIDIALMEDMAGMVGGQMLAEQPQQPGEKKPGGAMSSSNNESTKGNEPKGNKQGAQNQGPA